MQEMASVCPAKHTNFRKRRSVRHRKSGKWGAATIRHPIAKASFLAVPSGYKKQPGVTLTSSGKCGAMLWNPITKAPEWLGSYSTPEAEAAYTNKKLEFDAKQGTLYCTKTGKCGAMLWNPITKAPEWLGSYNTPQEAEAAYTNKKLEFDAKQGTLYRTKTGKWGASIRHPVTKALVSLGTHKTPKEAEYAYKKKKHEFDFLFVRKIRGVSHRKQGSVAGLHGVYQRTPGRWFAVIRNRITRLAEYSGPYDTAEEAEEARNRRKREFDDAMASAEKWHNKSNVVAEVDTQAQNGNVVSVIEGIITLKLDEVDMQHECALASKSEAGNSKIPVADDCSMDVVGKEDSDMGVIDAYGQLIGVFSRIDDELWLV